MGREKEREKEPPSQDWMQKTHDRHQKTLPRGPHLKCKRNRATDLRHTLRNHCRRRHSSVAQGPMQLSYSATRGQRVHNKGGRFWLLPLKHCWVFVGTSNKPRFSDVPSRSICEAIMGDLNRLTVESWHLATCSFTETFFWFMSWAQGHE